MQEKWILELYLSRDEEALLYTEAIYGDYCRGLISRYLTDQADVEACLSDLWRKAWESIPPAYPPSLQLFLAATARALALGKHRALPPKKRVDAPALPEGELAGCLPEGLSQVEAAARLDGYLATLSETERRLFVGRYWYALPVSELAALWGMEAAAVSAELSRLCDGLRALTTSEATTEETASEETATEEAATPVAATPVGATGARVMDALGDVSKKYLREAEPSALTALINTRVRKVDSVRRYKGLGLYVPPIGYKTPRRQKPLRPAKPWMTALAITVMVLYMLFSVLAGLAAILLSTAQPTDVPGVYIIAGVEVDLNALFDSLAEGGGKGSEEEETTTPPVRYPCVEEGHILTVWEDREATCYAVSHYKASCDRCAYEPETFGTERLPHTYENGACTVCGLLEGACDGVTAEPYLQDGVQGARVTNIETVTGDELILPNVCYVEGYGLLPVIFWDAVIPGHIVTLVVPEGYQVLGGVMERDENSNLKSVTLPSTLKRIGFRFFSNYTALTEITLPDGVIDIGTEAFKGCANLRLSRLPASLTELGESAFEGCGAITVSEIPAGVSVIAARAFADCASIPSMTLPENLLTIGEYAFYNCSSLASVNVPESVATLGKYAFSLCRGLTELTLSERLRVVEDGALSGTGLERLIVPASVQSMGIAALSGCTKLTEVVFEGETTSLEDNLFSGCTALTSVVLPAGLEIVGTWMFRDCSSLAEVVIPNSVTIIESWAFKGCSQLQRVRLPVNLREYGGDLFKECGALRELTMDEGGAFYTVRGNCLIAVNSKTLVLGTSAAVIPDDGSVEKIGSYAFRGTEVEVIVIPEGVTIIEDGAFSDCVKLTSLTVPSTLKDIEDYVLRGCTALVEIHANTTVSQWRILSAGEKMADVTDGRWSFTAYCTDGYLNPDRSAVYYEEEETVTEGQ